MPELIGHAAADVAKQVVAWHRGYGTSTGTVFSVDGTPWNDSCWRLSVRGDQGSVSPLPGDIRVFGFTTVADVLAALTKGGRSWRCLLTG
jgi:hypothetical protein